MYKVSFIKEYHKVKHFNDKVTIVTLVGKVDLWNPFLKMPTELEEWLTKRGFSIFDDTVTSIGKAVCSPEDTFDPTLGAMIAESRAKITLYVTMRNLCDKMITFYLKKLFGVTAIDFNMYKANQHNDTLFKAYQKYHDLAMVERKHLDTLIHGTSSESTTKS